MLNRKLFDVQGRSIIRLSSWKFCEGEISNRKRIGRPIARIVESDVSSPGNIYRQKRIHGFVTRCRYLEISNFQIDGIIKIGSELGVITALINTGQVRPYIRGISIFKRNNLKK